MYIVYIYENNLEVDSRQGDDIKSLINWAKTSLKPGQSWDYSLFPGIQTAIIQADCLNSRPFY